MIERLDVADSRLAILANEPIENTDRKDPTLPTDNTEPIEPIESIEPFESIDMTEPVELMDKIDRPDSRIGPSSTQWAWTRSSSSKQSVASGSTRGPHH